MQPLHFFLGANSEEGFSSLYEQLLGGRFDDLLILKGGAGSGKSTFMRRVGAAAERTGERVVYINCSGDPDSLDGAIFLDRRAAIVDGTAPHVLEPSYAAACERYGRGGERTPRGDARADGFCKAPPPHKRDPRP